MPHVEFQRENKNWHGHCTDTFDPLLGINGRTDSKQCKVCVTPGEAPSNSCRILWTPDDTQVYWSSLPSWTGRANLTYPTTNVLGNGVWANGDPFAYTVSGSNLTFDNASLISGAQWTNTDLASFTAENPGPIAWVMEDNPCEERQTRDSLITHTYNLGSTSYAIPADVNDVHATNAGTRVAFGPTVALTIVETVYVFSNLSWLGDSGGAASSHDIRLGVRMTSTVTERWTVVARSSGGSFGQPLVCTFSIESGNVGPNNSYQLDSTMAWQDSTELPSFYEGASGDLSRLVTGGGPESVITGPFQDLGGGVYQRASSGATLTGGILDGDDPGNILWSNNAPS